VVKLYAVCRVRLKAFYAVRANEKFHLSPTSQHGNVNEIIGKFNGAGSIISRHRFPVA
jgi:hypothetical protein